jgi:hypothetical protein
MFSDRQCADVVFAAVQAAKEGRPLIAVVSEHDDAEGGLSRFTAELQMAPQKALGEEFSPEGAVKDLILSIMRREYRERRMEIEHRIQTGQAANGEDLRLQNAQLTSDLKLLQKWETALPLLEMQGPAKAWNAKP